MIRIGDSGVIWTVQKCTQKGCRNGQPCVDRSGAYIERYAQEENHELIKTASGLVDNGRAGTLSRLEEITEYVQRRGYEKIGVAYCYGLEKYAVLLRKYFDRRGIKTVFRFLYGGRCDGK